MSECLSVSVGRGAAQVQEGRRQGRSPRFPQHQPWELDTEGPSQARGVQHR